jgi:acyl CoA:acetate/3-ketoacid CoA transferase alpha subunit
MLEPRQDFTVIENQAFEMAAAGTGISVMATRTGYGYWVQQAREAVEAERQSAAG